MMFVIIETFFMLLVTVLFSIGVFVSDKSDTVALLLEILVVSTQLGGLILIWSLVE